MAARVVNYSPVRTAVAYVQLLGAKPIHHAGQEGVQDVLLVKALNFARQRHLRTVFGGRPTQLEFVMSEAGGKCNVKAAGQVAAAHSFLRSRRCNIHAFCRLIFEKVTYKSITLWAETFFRRWQKNEAPPDSAALWSKWVPLIALHDVELHTCVLVAGVFLRGHAWVRFGHNS